MNGETSDNRLVKYLINMIYDVHGRGLSRRKHRLWRLLVSENYSLHYYTVTFFIRNDSFRIFINVYYPDRVRSYNFI